jgi:hypothetical protein
MIVINSDKYVNSYWMINGVVECCKLEDIQNTNLSREEIKDIYEETFNNQSSHENQDEKQDEKRYEEELIQNIAPRNVYKSSAKNRYRNRGNLLLDPFSKPRIINL